MSLNVLMLDVIISRLVEAVIVICINHILEAVHHIIARHIAINHPAELLKVVARGFLQYFSNNKYGLLPYDKQGG